MGHAGGRSVQVLGDLVDSRSTPQSGRASTAVACGQTLTGVGNLSMLRIDDGVS